VTNHFTHAGVGQSNGNTTDTVHISVLKYGVGHLLPSVEPQSFLEWTRASSERLLEERLPVALAKLKVRICSSL
jgi:hypothetical protein